MKRLGILGGTFDPPHLGHLVLAEFATDFLRLDHVLFVPAGDPPHKRNLTRASVDHRLAMVQLAIGDNPRFSISRVDIDRPGPHYTLDTMRIMSEQYPNVELFFLMGSDSFRDLPKWNRPLEIVQYCDFGVMARPGDNRSDSDVHPEMHDAVLPNFSRHVKLIEAPLLDVAAKDIVDRLNQHKTVRYLVPDAVLDYIFAHHIYEDSQA